MTLIALYFKHLAAFWNTERDQAIPQRHSILTPPAISVDFDWHRLGASLILEVTGCFVLLLLSSPFSPLARLLPAPSRKRRRRPIRRANRAAASAGCRMASAAKRQ